MPKQNPNKDKDKKEKVLILHDQGLSLREIGAVVNRSHEWVRQVLVEKQTVDKG